MTTGEMMVYGGIVLMILAFIMFIVLSVIFSKRKKKVLEKIYG